MTGRRVFEGEGLTPLAGAGPIHRYRPDAGIAVEAVEADDPAAERERFQAARDAALADLEALESRTADATGDAEADVFRTHRAFLTDPTLEGPSSTASTRGGRRKRPSTRRSTR
ncbi:phosphoenolpyruvate-utilizing N-terminal domain-containing protein [Halosimplex aquaticum]